MKTSLNCFFSIRKFLVLLLFLLMLSPEIFAKPAQVLMLGHYSSREFEPWWPRFQEACRKQGVEIYIYDKDTKNGIDYDVYTDDVLKQFNVVIYIGLPVKTSNTSTSKEGVDMFLKRLDSFYQAGGGVIWVPEAFDHWAERWNEVVGKNYDVKCLEEEIYDPSKTVDINPALNKDYYRYIWTTNVIPHPVTEGVKGLFLPVLGEWSWPGTVPMKFGRSWQVMIKGMDTTKTMGNAAPSGSGRHEFKPEIKGTYASSPEIIGVRDQVGKSGRMMVFPFHTTHTWKNFGHFAFNDAMMLNGDGVHPSDGLKLIANACKWLAEPAIKASLGGYKAPDKNTKPAWTIIDWDKAAFPENSWSGLGAWWNDSRQIEMPMGNMEASQAKDFKGIVGVRTVASDGEGTVSDYVAAAKKLGISYIIFLENMEKSDDTRFGKLVEDCAKYSDDSFSAIPGYLYRDRGGNLHFAYGVKNLPMADNLTSERRVISPNNIVDQNSWSNGQGIAELGRLKVDLAYLFLFTNIAPYVYDGTKLEDDGLEKYIYSEGLGHQFSPVSLTIVRSPADLEKVAATNHLTVAHIVGLDELRKALGRNNMHPMPVYLSNGPVISRWGALNPLGHPFWPGKNRVRIALETSSETGIADVQLIDARTGGVFRHFKPGGVKNFSCTVDEDHKKQLYLVPIVTDSKGRTAVGSGLVTFQDGNRIWMMGDRLMGLHHGMGWDEKHEKLVKTGGWIGHPWTKPYEANGSAPPNSRAEELKIQGIDGGNVSSSALDIEPSITVNGNVEPKVQSYRFRPTLSSFDLAIMDYEGGLQFLTNTRKDKSHPGWWSTPDVPVPFENADINERVWAVRSRYHATVAANVHEVTVKFKKDGKFENLDLGGFRTGKERIAPFFYWKDQEGEYAWQAESPTSFKRKGTMDAGGYLVPANYRGGAVGVINLGPQPLDYTFDGQRGRILVDGKGKSVKKGDTLTVRFVVLMKPWQGQMNNKWIKDFISGFGIGCPPGYTHKLTQGKLRNAGYALDVDAVKGGATLSVDACDLPHNLPVRVFGVPNNAIVGRYDLNARQLLILPVFEGMAATSIYTNGRKTSLYVGELFHCDDDEVLLSAVQGGADKILLEVHNPTAKSKKVSLSSVTGFAPFSKLKETVKVEPYSSQKLVLTSNGGSLVYEPYQGE